MTLLISFFMLQDQLSVQELMQEFRVPGVAIGWIVNGETHSEFYGSRRMEQNLPIDEQTLFPIGSITKSMTGLLALTYVLDGTFQLDCKVRDLNPNYKDARPGWSDELRLVDLLSHQSGFLRHDLLWETGMPAADIVKAIPYLETLAAFRPGFNYSNINYLVAGQAMAIHSGVAWDVALREKVFRPLGMDHTHALGIDLPIENMARPHTIGEGDLGLLELKERDRHIQQIAPAGSVVSNLQDMLRYSEFWLNGSQSLPLESLQTALEPRTLIAHFPSEKMPDRGLVGYGLGWILEWYRGNFVTFHSGVVRGYSAQILLVPRQKIAVVVLTNRFGNPLPDILCRRKAEEALKLPPIDWAAFYRQDEAETRPEEENFPSIDPNLQWAGTYRNSGYGSIQLSDKFITFGDQNGNLTFLGRNQIRARFEGEDGHRDFLLGLEFDAQQKVSGFAASLDPQAAPIKFIRVP